MKRKVIALGFVAALCSVSTQIISMSEGGFNMTGAPTENDCTGCHQGTANSDKEGSVKIEIAGNPTAYEPGKTYEVKVTTAHPLRNKFGFALSVRKDNHAFIPVGELLVDENAGVRGFGFASHMGQSNTGSGSKTWVFNWKAPAVSEGKLTLYAAGVAANNNGSNLGDFVYTTSLVLQPQGTTGLADFSGEHQPEVFPTIVNNKVFVSYKPTGKQRVNISLVALNGAELKQLFDEETNGLEQREFIIAPPAPGIYLFRIRAGASEHITKIVCQ